MRSVLRVVVGLLAVLVAVVGGLIIGARFSDGPVAILPGGPFESGKLVSGPEIHARGFAEDDSTFDEIKQPIVDALDAAIAEGNTDSYQLQQTVRRVVGRWVSNTHRRRPMIIPVVLEA